MDDLPPPIIIEILSRLSDSSDLAHSRLTCKTLNSLSYDVTSITFRSSFAQYIRLRSQSSNSTIPFKSNVTRSILKLSRLSSITVRVDEGLEVLSYDDAEDYESDGDDLYLTDFDFVSNWLPFVGDGLKSLSFVDFWVQSCSRKSRVLSLISFHCQSLNQLNIKMAWLSVEGLRVMPSLTSLTLEFVRLEDENLSIINDCFPNLQTLNLLGVGGLKDPEICLQKLQTCQWTISNAPLSLTIIAPKMVSLKLKCVRPKTLVLETPLLSHLDLTLEKADTFSVVEFSHLKKLNLESGNLWSFIESFPCCNRIDELRLESLKKVEPFKAKILNLDWLFDVFPSLRLLTLGPRAYGEMENSFNVGKVYESKGLKSLKEFRANLVVKDVEVTLSFISYIIDKCDMLCTMFLRIHYDLDSKLADVLISKTIAKFPQIRWKWWFWRESIRDSMGDYLVCDGERCFEGIARFPIFNH